MTADADESTSVSLPELPRSDFTEVSLEPAYSTGDSPLDEFYVPLLARAVEYKRLVGYFSGRILARAAAGFAPFVARGGSVQLVVGAQLLDEDVDAVMAGDPLDDLVASRLRAEPLTEGVSIIEQEHLRLLAWMLREGQLELRVGVPVDSAGRPLRPIEATRYFHSKFGLFTDELGRQVAFSGSDNETLAGWTGNHETFYVFWSWNESVWPMYGGDVAERLDRHWNGAPDAGWAVLPVPVAVEQHLLEIVPPGWQPPSEDADPRLRLQPREPGRTPDDSEEKTDGSRVGDKGLKDDPAAVLEILDAPTSRTMVGIASAAVEPLPHQQLIAVRAVESYPRGYLLADEVGLGKTIEAGLIIRELLLSKQAQSALLLVPAGVLKQWQEELHEKLSLDVLRYESGGFYNYHDEVVEPPDSSNPWRAASVVLASSHLARRNDRRDQLLEAGPWDIVFVDEAHHARRRGLKANGTPNTLLELLQAMKDRKSWKVLYLASATPMQMAPHEAWDLIELLGLPGAWSESASLFVRYFAELKKASPDRDWVLLSRMLRDQIEAPNARTDEQLRSTIVHKLGPVRSRTLFRLHEPPVPTRSRVAGWSEDQGEMVDVWLRAHTPMRDRVFRHTRGTMREYKKQGLLPPDLVIPRRLIRDEFVTLTPGERALYDRLDAYISKYYNAHLATAATSSTSRALGFIMTIYRRRLTSSFHAVRLSLDRRRSLLESGRRVSVGELLDPDDKFAHDDDDLAVGGDGSSVSAASDDLLAAELAELSSFIQDIDDLGSQDSKADLFHDDLASALAAGYDSVVVFTQYTDTMDYLRERVASSYSRVACYSGRGGEQWDSTRREWVTISKAELKSAFRGGDIRVLLGTDSMSEGLNLQTCGKLFNYDMPWNLMRVEQRIGRVDRIGASYELVTITNYFYADTVEQKIYTSIKADFGDFTDIVGDAQPVLAATEGVVRTAAMAASQADADRAIANGVQGIRALVAATSDSALKLSDAEEESFTVPELHPSATLADLEQAIKGCAITNSWLSLENEGLEAYMLTVPGCRSRRVAFDRNSVDRSPKEISLFTWGTDEANAVKNVLEGRTMD